MDGPDRWERANATRERMDEARWRELCGRRLRGEEIRALAAEYQVSISSIYRWSRILNMRLVDQPDAVKPRKGPVPVVMTADGVTCGALAFVFDPADPEATVESILEQAVPAAAAGASGLFNTLMTMGERTLRLADRLDRRRERREAREAKAAALMEEGAARPALVLRPAQTPPQACEDGRHWSTWLFLGGRGAGKTLAGASWLADQALALGPGGRLAMVGATLHDVREVMIEGISGVCSLPRWTEANRPVFEPSRRLLRFANGCVAHVFSAEEPDRLRGPQFAGAWVDEFCTWRRGGETLALLRMGLRIGGATGRPRLVVTTTPRPTKALTRLRAEAGCVVTHAGTAENAAHLSPGFLDELLDLYGGTRRAAQELEGRIVEIDGALFTATMMADARGEGRQDEGGNGGVSPLDPHPSSLEHIVVAIDPTASLGGDACGIVAAGVRTDADKVRRAVVLADRSARGLSPERWARRALDLATEVGAQAIVAEVNQGGDMVKAVLKAAGCSLKIVEVRASRGKRLRAEPVAALYEQGRVHHSGTFGALEEELMALGGEMEEAGSLDRADALVWAITHLLLDRPTGGYGPRLRLT